MLWSDSESGVVVMPSGRKIRGRSYRQEPETRADITVLLRGKRPVTAENEIAWVKCRDFWTPDRDELRAALTYALAQSDIQRVEVSCGGGVGRTGLALACMAILEGIDPSQAVTFVRENYNPRAIETPWQRRFVDHFAD